MRLYVSGSIATLRRTAHRYRAGMGVLLTPRNRNSVEAAVRLRLPWAIDNGAFSGFDDAAFALLCERARGKPRLQWVVAPDVVADARATLRLWRAWQPLLDGLPLAYVGQDGAEDLELPDGPVCLFLGGSTSWKLSRAAADLAGEARARGWTVHMGRVNSRRRIRIARMMGCDSCDGSSASRFGDKYMPAFLRWVRNEREQPLLFGG